MHEGEMEVGGDQSRRQNRVGITLGQNIIGFLLGQDLFHTGQHPAELMGEGAGADFKAKAWVGQV